jgi:hypothetical protein
VTPAAPVFWTTVEGIGVTPAAAVLWTTVEGIKVTPAVVVGWMPPATTWLDGAILPLTGTAALPEYGTV